MLDAFQGTYTMLVAFYLAARLFMASYLLILAGVVPMVRNMMLVHVFLVRFHQDNLLFSAALLVHRRTHAVPLNVQGLITS